MSLFPGNRLNPVLKRLLVLLNRDSEASVWCFLKSLRCLIYKVHAVSGGTFCIITAFISLVKHFFQSFLTFAIRLLSAATLLGYHTRKDLSSTFSNFFKTFAFQTPPRHLSADSLVRIPLHLPFVNTFFRLFVFSFNIYYLFS